MGRIVKPVLIGAILMACVGVGYWYWTTTPSYAIGQIVSAVQKKDQPKFEAYVDVDRVLDQVIDELVGSAIDATAEKDESNDQGFLAAIGKSIGAGIASMMKAPIKTAVKMEIDDWFADKKHAAESASSGQARDTGMAASVTNYRHKFGKDVSREYLKVNGATANLGVKVRHAKLQRDFVLDIKMERSHQWRVVELTNLREVVRELRAAERAALTSHNQPMQQRLETALTLSSFSKQNLETSSEWHQKVRISVFAKPEKQVAEFAGEFVVQVDGQEVLREKFIGKELTTDGQEIAFEKTINPFVSNEKLLHEAGDPSIEFELSRLKFSDGEHLEMLDSFDDIP